MYCDLFVKLTSMMKHSEKTQKRHKIKQKWKKRHRIDEPTSSYMLQVLYFTNKSLNNNNNKSREPKCHVFYHEMHRNHHKL